MTSGGNTDFMSGDRVCKLTLIFVSSSMIALYFLIIQPGYPLLNSPFLHAGYWLATIYLLFGLSRLFQWRKISIVFAGIIGALLVGMLRLRP